MIGFDPFTLYLASIAFSAAFTLLMLLVVRLVFGTKKDIPASPDVEVDLKREEPSPVLNPVITPEITPNVTYVAPKCPGDHLRNPNEGEHVNNTKIQQTSNEVDIDDQWSAMVKKAKEKSAALALEV